jgi:hypothetical protein
MKVTTLIGFTSALAVQFALGTNQTNTPAPPKPIGRHVQPDISKWDLNHNGKLDADEMEAYRRDQVKQRHDEVQRHIEQMSANAKASAELQRLEAGARGSNTVVVPNGFWRKFDENGNGVLEPEEREKYKQALAKLRAAQQAAPPSTNRPTANSSAQRANAAPAR